MKRLPAALALAFPLMTFAQSGLTPNGADNAGVFDGSTGIYHSCVIADGVGGGFWQVQLQGRDEPDLGPDMFSLELIAADEAEFEACGTLFDQDTGEFIGLVVATNTNADFNERTFLFNALIDPNAEGFRFITNLVENFVDVSEPSDPDDPENGPLVAVEIVDPGSFTNQTQRYELRNRPTTLSLSAPVCLATLERGAGAVNLPSSVEISASGLSFNQEGNTVQVATGSLSTGSYAISARCLAEFGDQAYASESVSVLVHIDPNQPTTPPNQPPSFTAGADQVVDEDAGPQTVPNWATDISPGPADEASQSVHFNVSNDNNDLFAEQPAIDADGTLTYTPADDAFGETTVTVTAQDDGGTDNGGVDTSDPVTFTITVLSVNDPPTFTAGGDQTVTENAGAQSIANWATDISPGPANESDQTVHFNVSNDNEALFTAQPAISNNGTLTFTAATGTFGSATVTVTAQDDGGTDNGGVDTSAVVTFTITVEPINRAPSFTAGANQTVNEDAGPQTVENWATNISPGPAHESEQNVHFNVSNDNEAMFAAQPAIRPDGTLTYTPADDAFGETTVTVTLQDDGGTANGGVDTSDPVTFTITINPVNDPPSFTGGGDQTVLEDAGLQTVANWATNISPGPANESDQNVLFNVSNDNEALFAAQPAISPDGTLTYTPADDAFGEATVTVTAQDDGGTANGGADTSAPQTFSITVLPVNDPPTFTPGLDQVVDEDAGPQTVPNWATNISPGPANESDQNVHFNVSNDNEALFAAQPAIDADGTLTYTTADDAYGLATVTVTAQDDGGTANGGVDTSAPVTFTITVNPVNDPPIAEAQSLIIEEDTPTVITLEAFDVDGDDLTFTITEHPDIGTLGTVVPDPQNNQRATVTYTGVADDLNLDLNEYNTAFVFRVTDPDGASDEATVDLTVQAINNRPNIAINGQTSVFDSESAVIADPLPVITVTGPTDVEYEYSDAESHAGDGSARAPYYFNIRMISIPDGDAGENPPFQFRNFDVHQLASTRVVVPPDFETGNFGYVQYTTTIGRANRLFGGFEIRMSLDGEYVFQLNVLDNGFLGRCPAELETPPTGFFPPGDYRITVGRNGRLINDNPLRCNRESTIEIRFNNTVEEGQDFNVVTFRAPPLP